MSQVCRRRVAMSLSGIADEPHWFPEAVQGGEELLALGEGSGVVHIAGDDEHRGRDRVDARQRARVAVEIPVPVGRGAEMSLSAFGPARCPEPFAGVVSESS